MPKVIINYRQKSTKAPKKYKSNIHIRELKKKPGHTDVDVELPNHVKLESFYVSGMNYFINWETGYIFKLDVNADDLSKPIGQLTDGAHHDVQSKESKYPLMNRQIEWYYCYTF